MRVLRRSRGLLAAVVVSVLVLAACEPQTWVGWQHTPVRGYPEVSAKQLGDYVQLTYWYNGGTVNTPCGELPYRASVSPHTLAALFIEEGVAQFIRGDLAFAQSILETGWFSFCGQVPPSANNFAGIGATGNPDDVWHFSTVRIGVRAQMQRLNRYANPANASSLTRPLVTQRGWSDATQYNNWWPWSDVSQGSLSTWQSLTGRWATSECYDTRIMRIYNEMRTHFGMSPYPVQAKSGC